MTLTVGSLFSGIEGIGLGLERAGMQVRWQCEVDEKCRELLNERWPTVPVYDDVRTVQGGDVERVDVLCGGFPCQDVSVAGNRAGLAGGRTGLFWEFCRLIAEIAPRWVLLENVPGLLSSCGCPECRPEGEPVDLDDLPFRDEMDDTEFVPAKPEHRGRDMAAVVGALTELGYGVAWRVLDAQYFGVAQRRRRVFIVGCAGDPARAASVLFEPESCEGNPAPSREAREDLAGTLGGGSGRRGFCADLDRSGAFIPVKMPELSVPLTARASMDRPEGGAVTLIPVAFSHTQGLDAQASASSRPTLRAEGGGQAVAYPLAVRGREDGAEMEMGEEGVYNALRAGDGGSSRSNWVAFSENQRAEVLETPYVRQMTTTGGGKPGQGYPAVRQGMAVRRLTPLECERLQGFPDGWTEGFTDSTRYRMLGNAVAVPCATWIGRRIMEAAA